MPSVLFTQKYFPSSFESFVGNGELVREVQNWALEWTKKGPQKPLLFFGSTGSGKTCLAELTAKLMGWDLFELNASHFRTKEIVEKVVGAASANASFSGKLRLILLDEIDALQSREDKGGMSAVLSVLKESKNPVILTANDIYENQRMAEIRNFCKKLEFKKPNYLGLAKFLHFVCESEHIDFDQESLGLLARNANGDIRSALLDLQTIAVESGKVTMADVEAMGFRDRQEKIFSTLQKIFRGKTVAEVQKAKSASDADLDMLVRWIEENIPLEFPIAPERATAFDRLSRSDLFSGRILRFQHWGFLRYASELATSGVALAREKPSHDFIMYKFPGLLRLLSASSADRQLKKKLGSKIGKKTHSSSRVFASQDLPYWQVLFESKPHAIRLSAEFGLSADEIGFLMDADPKGKAVQEIFDSSQLLAEKSAADRMQLPSGLRLPSASKPDQKQPENSPPADSHVQTKLF